MLESDLMDISLFAVLQIWTRHEVLSKTIGTLKIENESHHRATQYFYASIISFLVATTIEIVIFYVYNRWVYVVRI